MNWLCRMIGHKWVTYVKARREGKRVLRETIWPVCLRCGTATPHELTQPENYEEADNGAV